MKQLVSVSKLTLDSLRALRAGFAEASADGRALDLTAFTEVIHPALCMIHFSPRERAAAKRRGIGLNGPQLRNKERLLRALATRLFALFDVNSDGCVSFEVSGYFARNHSNKHERLGIVCRHWEDDLCIHGRQN